MKRKGVNMRPTDDMEQSRKLWLSTMPVTLFCLLSLLISICPTLSAAIDSRPTPKKILLLNSYHKGYLWTDQITRGVEDTLAGKNIDLHIEYMDTKRQFDEDYQNLLANILKLKHSRHQYDLVITSDNNAFDFIRKRGHNILGDVPVVFCGVNYLTKNDLEGTKGITGVNERADIASNLQLIEQLHPTCKRIVVITDDTTTGKRIQEEVRRLSKDHGSKLPKIELLYDITAENLVTKLKQLPPDTVVLLTFFFRDKKGTFFEYDKAGPMICENSSVPVYGAWNFHFGHGIVGGYLVDGYEQGVTAAKKALAILNGKPVDQEPVRFDTPTPLRFNYPQLVRHGIPLAKLPKGAEILNKPKSFYYDHRHLINGIVAAFIFLVLFSLALSYSLVRSRRAEKRARESEENLHTTMRSIGDAVIATDTKGTIVHMNPVAEKLTGRTIADARGKPASSVFNIIQFHTREKAENPIDKVLADRKALEMVNSTILISRDKAEYRVSYTATPIQSEAGEIHGAVLVFRDITAETVLQDQLRHSHKMDAIGQLAGGVAHDFNNMLGGIMGAAELIGRRLPDDPRLQKYHRMIMETAASAAGLTEKLLAFARKQSSTFHTIEIHEILKDSIEILESTIDRRIQVVQDLSAEFSLINGDAPLLQSALLNLGINASQSMPDGGKIYISTSDTILDTEYCASSPFDIDAGSYLEIEICDTGCGIPAEDLPHIFEPFFTTKDQGEGTGLGLSAVFGTVQQHDGAITVDSSIGAGTSFHIFLPLTNLHPEDKTQGPTEIHGSGLIMVVDDEDVMRATAKEILEYLGYEVLTAENGETAIQLFKENKERIDLVLLDMVMPVMNGRDCFLAMQELKPDVKIVVCSGFTHEGILEELRELGLKGFIRKPYRSAPLSKAVFDALS